MEERRKHIDDWFREGLAGYQEMPDAQVWNDLEKRLPKKRGNRRFAWLFLLLPLALLSSLGYYYLLHDNYSEKQSANTTANTAKHFKKNPQEKTPTLEYIEKNKPSAAKLLHPIESSKKPTTRNPINNNTRFEQEKKDEKNITINKTPSIKNEHTIPKNEVEKNTSLHQNTTRQPVPYPEADRNAHGISVATNNSSDPVLKNTPVPLQEVPKQKDEKILTAENKNPVALQENLTTPSITPPDNAGTTTAPTTPIAEEKTEITKDTKFENTSIKNAAQPLPDARTSGIPVKDYTAADKPHNTATPETPPQKTTSPHTSLSHEIPLYAVDRAEKGKSLDAKVFESSGKPIYTRDYNSDKKELPVNDYTSKGAAINNETYPSPENDILKTQSVEDAQPIQVPTKKLKDKPLLIDAPKDYGIKMNDLMNENETNNEGAHQDISLNQNNAKKAGGGGGGANEDKEKNKKGHSAITGGIKLGWEQGFAAIKTNSIIGNLFLEWNISDKVALILQPGLRYSTLNKTNLFATDSYHQVTGAAVDSAHIRFGNPAVGDSIQRNYIYRNTYDSIIANYGITQKQFIEIELPLLLQYRFTENMSLMAGFQMSFGKLLEIGSTTQRFGGLGKSDTLSYAPVSDSFNTPPVIPSPNGYFSYSTETFDKYDANKYKNPVINRPRFGLMVGLSYEWKRRLLVDLMMRKNLSSMNHIPNEQIRKIYQQPQFRITIGYRLFGDK